MRGAGPAQRRGVALVQALVVVAALAAVAAALMEQARRATEALALRAAAAQAAAYLDAGLLQAQAELAALVGAGPLRLQGDWAAPRRVPIDRGRVAWQAADLQGRFNLAWLADPGEAGAAAAAALVRLATGAGLPMPLAERLARAAGPDAVARAAALGAAAAPEVPLRQVAELAAVPRAAEGGAAALAPLVPLLAALPPEAPFNPLTAPLPVLAALIPGLSAADWAAFDAARRSGALAHAEALPRWAADRWPPSAAAAAARLPLGDAAGWLLLALEAELDGIRLRREVVLELAAGPDGRPRLEPRQVRPVPD